MADECKVCEDTTDCLGCPFNDKNSEFLMAMEEERRIQDLLEM